MFTKTKQLKTSNINSVKKYVAPTGNDNNPGTSQKPFKTIAKATENLVPGDEVIIKNGVYRESIILSNLNGTSDKPIIIRGEGEQAATSLNIKWYGKDKDSDFPVMTSLNELPASAKWKSIGENIYETSVNDLVLGDKGSGLVLLNNKQIFWYKDLDMLKQIPRETMEEAKKGHKVELGLTKKIRGDGFEALPAWTYDESTKKLYMRLTPGDSPSNYTSVKYATLDDAFTLNDCKNVIISNLDMGYYASHGIRLTGDSDHNIIYNNLVHHCPNDIVLIGADDLDKRMDENTIWGNNIFNYGFWQYTWRAMMASRAGYNGILVSTIGRGNAIISNSIHNVFNAATLNSFRGVSYSRDFNRDMDVIDNLCYNIGDDSWEPDGGGINVRVLDNKSINALELISLAPVKVGPLYVVGNYGIARNYSFKFNNVEESTGHTYLYNNTGVCIGNGTKAFQYPGLKFAFDNKIAKNNIFVFNGEASSSMRKGITLDYNCYYNYGKDKSVVFQFADLAKSISFQDLYTQTGLEQHGFSAEPGMKSPITISDEDIIKAYQNDDILPFDFNLKPFSICVDKGVLIKGLNRAYSGKSPDIGAMEYQP